jgi:phosphoenolpyruvate synthase/pyruvate phosphate dikinase
MEPQVIPFSGIGIHNIAEVGGKNASLGEMFTQLSGKGVRVPDGFATTATAFWQFLDTNDLREPLQQLLQQLDRKAPIPTFARLENRPGNWSCRQNCPMHCSMLSLSNMRNCAVTLIVP